MCNNNHLQWLSTVFCELSMWKTHTHSKQEFTPPPPPKKKHRQWSHIGLLGN